MNRPVTLHAIITGGADRQAFTVGRASVDPISRDARWPGGQERLQPQTLKVLITLLSRRGEVVTRDELIQLCWDGRIVGDDVINRSISLLRQFAEHAGGFRIETVSRAGYRLMESEAAASSTRKRKWFAAAAVVIVGVAGLSAWALERPSISQGAPPAPSILIKPFVADAGDPLARQVALAAPNSLSRMLSQSGFENVRDDATPAPGAPPSDYVLTGDVWRMGPSLETTVRMVSRRDGTIAFAHDFSAPIDRADDLPDRIGATAAAELAWTGAQMVLDPHEHLSPEVASELMNSMNLAIEDGNSLRGYQLARHAAALAPDSAMAQLTLAVQSGFAISSIPRDERAEAVALGLRASARARAMAPEFGDVYLTDCRLHSPVRMTECDAAARRAIEVDPQSSYAPGYLSTLLYNAGRIGDSVELARQSLANDPYKPAKMARMIRMLEASGRSDESEKIYREATRLWPDSGRMRVSRLVGMAEAGDYAALERFADPQLDGDTIDLSVIKALVAAEHGHDRAQADRACAAKGLRPLTQLTCMTVLADVGDLDRAFAIAAARYPASQAAPGADEDRIWLDHPDGFQIATLTGPAGKALRSDPRFLALARKQGLLEYWLKDGLPDFCRRPQPEPVCSRLMVYR